MEQQIKIILEEIANGEEIPTAWGKVKIKSIHKKKAQLWK